MTGPASPNDGIPQGLLEKILTELRHSVRKEHFDTWFLDLKLDRIEGERYHFTVSNGFVRDWLRKNYQSLIESAVRSATGRRRCEVALQLGRERPAGEPASGVATALAEGLVGARSSEGSAEVLVDDEAEPGADLTARSRSRLPGRADPASPNIDEAEREPAAPAWRGGVGEGFSAIPAPSPAVRRNGHQAGLRGSNSWDQGLQLGGLNRTYTFDQFVVGPCNRLSHAAALAVADTPGLAYNPLFIHGNVGLGKTHLLQAICHETRRKDPNARVLYLSCEDFTNRFIHAVQLGRLDDFREFHRSADVLVIDDIQFFANKEKTQDEFFHTFNALYNANRQIIISSDRLPSHIPTIEERLVSRFRWGFVAEMVVPCFETRTAIVRRKAKLRQIDLPDDVAYCIAERVDTNIRELEGAVVKVLGVASITEREITVELAKEALRGVVMQRTRQITVSEIMGLVTSEFSISARDLTGKKRTHAISLPRQICMYLCRLHTGLSLEEIGKYFGGRDHTTVLYAVNKIA